MATLTLTPKNLAVIALVVVLAVGAAIGGLRSCRQTDPAHVQEMKFLFKCTSATCGEVVEWTGAKVGQERQRMAQEDLKAGGAGVPKIKMKCPKCGAPLAPGQRLASGEVQALGNGLDPMAEVLKPRQPITPLE